MDWRLASFVVMMLYGIGTFFVSKSNRIHGGEVACFLQLVAYAILLVLIGFGRSDLTRITRSSLMFGSTAAGLFVIATLMLFKLFASHPKETAIISVITEGWPIITALLIHLTGQPLTGRQWSGIFFVTIGMVLVSLPQNK